MEFGQIRGNAGNFGKKGELSGIQWGFVWRLISIQWEFLGIRGNAGFSGKFGFGVVSGDLGPQKAFAQIAKWAWLPLRKDPQGLFSEGP